MIAAKDTVLILLAAGRSSRFGVADKLAANLDNRPVGLHVVTALTAVPFKARIAVVAGHGPTFPCYEIIHNADVSKGQSHSIRLGVARAKALGADAVLIALADMPRVTARHIDRLLDAADGPDAVVSSSDGITASPPAVFGKNRFDALMALTGDEGARDLVKAGRHVVASPAELIDIDTPDDLIRAAAHRSD